jgi:hypothetical protein
MVTAMDDGIEDGQSGDDRWWKEEILTGNLNVAEHGRASTDNALSEVVRVWREIQRDRKRESYDSSDPRSARKCVTCRVMPERYEKCFESLLHANWHEKSDDTSEISADTDNAVAETAL